jgi:hypothetical protein
MRRFLSITPLFWRREGAITRVWRRGGAIALIFALGGTGCGGCVDDDPRAPKPAPQMGSLAGSRRIQVVSPLVAGDAAPGDR